MPVPGLGRILPVGGEAAAVGKLAGDELARGDAGKVAEVAREVRLIVVAAVERNLGQRDAAARL